MTGSQPGATGFSLPVAKSGSTPGTGLAYSLLALMLVLLLSPPQVRSVVWLAARLVRFACRRASDPSVFLAMVAGDAGRLNGRVSIERAGEPEQEEHVAVHQLLWHEPGCGLGGIGERKGV